MFGLRKLGECWVLCAGVCTVNSGKFQNDIWYGRCNNIFELLSKTFCKPMLGRQESGVCISINLKKLNCIYIFIV